MIFFDLILFDPDPCLLPEPLDPAGEGLRSGGSGVQRSGEFQRGDGLVQERSRERTRSHSIVRGPDGDSVGSGCLPVWQGFVVAVGKSLASPDIRQSWGRLVLFC